MPDIEIDAASAAGSSVSGIADSVRQAADALHGFREALASMPLTYAWSAGDRGAELSQAISYAGSASGAIDCSGVTYAGSGYGSDASEPYVNPWNDLLHTPFAAPDWYPYITIDGSGIDESEMQKIIDDDDDSAAVGFDDAMEGL